MHKKLALLTLMNIVMTLSLSGCGSYDNVAACEAWVETMTCGETDFSTLVVCSNYEAIECNIADYFDCLTENYSCDMGVADTAGWAACSALAVCEE